MCLSKFVKLAEQELPVCNGIVPLVSVNVDTLLVADWLKAKMVQPMNSGPQANGAREVWRQMHRREEVIVDPATERVSRHVGLSLDECMLSHSHCSLLVDFLIVIKALSVIFALPPLQ